MTKTGTDMSSVPLEKLTVYLLNGTANTTVQLWTCQGLNLFKHSKVLKEK